MDRAVAVDRNVLFLRLFQTGSKSRRMHSVRTKQFLNETDYPFEIDAVFPQRVVCIDQNVLRGLEHYCKLSAES
jgi:hypothetical protein